MIEIIISENDDNDGRPLRISIFGQNYWVKIEFLEILGVYSICRLTHGVSPICHLKKAGLYTISFGLKKGGLSV